MPRRVGIYDSREGRRLQVGATAFEIFPGASMRTSRFSRQIRGGVLLDAVVVLALILVGAFALESVGISFHELVRGAESFFGL